MNSRTLERVAIGSLRLPPQPVRYNPKKQIEKARQFMAEFGQVPLVYAAPDGEILGGEEYWLALKDAGAADIDVAIIHGKSTTELKAIRLALHRIPQDARWDEHNVRIVLEELETADFDLSLTGLEPAEIDVLLNLDVPDKNVEETGTDIPAKERLAVSRIGSVWNLGTRHRIGCGSAIDLAFVQLVLGDRLAAASFIDAPYNIPIAGFVSGKGRHQHREFVQGTGEMTDERYFALLRDSLAVLQSISTSRALIFSCIDWRHALEMLAAGRNLGMALYQIAVWVKSNGGMGGVYRNQHELIAIFRAGADGPLDNVELGKRGRNRTNVWHYPGMSSFGRDRDTLLGMHPTTKPVAMIADALRDVTQRGDVVVDTFSGSGSTLMAADETGRIFRGVDLDPLYVDVAVRRWQKATGRQAVSAETGVPFDDVQERTHLALPRPRHGA